MLSVESRIKQGRNHNHQPDHHSHWHHTNSWRNNHIAWMPEARQGIKQLLQALVKLIMAWTRSSDGPVAQMDRAAVS